METLDEFFHKFEEPEASKQRTNVPQLSGKKRKGERGNGNSKQQAVDTEVETLDEFFVSFEKQAPSDSEMKFNGKVTMAKKRKSRDKGGREKTDELASTGKPAKPEKVRKILHAEDEAFASFLENEDPELLEFQDEDLDDSDASGEEGNIESANIVSEFVGDENNLEDAAESEPEDIVNQSLVKGVKKWTRLCESGTANIATCKSMTRAFVELSTPMTAAFGASKKSREQAMQSSESDEVLLNSIMELISLHLKPTLSKLLGTKVAEKREMLYTSLPKWTSVSSALQKYFMASCKVIEANLQYDLIYKLLKHLIVMRSYLRCFPKVTNQVIAAVSSLWVQKSNADVELSAFLLLERIAKLDMEVYHQEIVRKAIAAYQKKASASSLDTLSKIAFMQQCVVQLLALDLNYTYKLMFDSVKSIVLLVKAVSIDKKKESQPELCSWKTVHTLYLWVSVFASIKNFGILASLVYPIVETIKEIINFASGPRYYPLRFHCIDMLVILAKSTGKFIPIFQHVLDIFSQTDFNVRPKKLSVRPFNLSGTIRFSEQDLSEKGFLDCVVERMYRLLLEIMSMHAYSIASPELFLLPIVHIRKFLKACANKEYVQKFKQLVEKMEENAQFISTEREKVAFSIHDSNQIAKWEASMEKEGKAPAALFHKRYVEIELKNKAVREKISNQQKNSKQRRKDRKREDRNKPDFHSRKVKKWKKGKKPVKSA